ncbi:aminotransferase class V-fold PLP-dependent enzyme [Bradyrhizobium prioriisuperbiae]|uniref:aminotransferase class V-fold PLP-dependent enzyme n=1 Tax=Bradyrhizobium prioriisuperbiae TaxID=2854389 RepID=UPI0028E850E7|nr:aminotransferase class V-fold PLP-dependent enzyme [Bradyrhizobium prioritasuperba]
MIQSTSLSLDMARSRGDDGTFNWQEARRLTSGCSHIVHLNNAGAALMPDCVLESTISYLRDEARFGAYETAERSRGAIERVYDIAAALLNCSPTEIAVVENASRAWNLAFGSIGFRAGEVVVTSTFEYANNYIAIMQAKKRHGLRIEVVPSTPLGELSLDALRNIIASHGARMRVISVTHVPTNNGVVNPAEEVGSLIREAKATGVLSERALYIQDACQSIGQIPIDARTGGFDILTTCGRKYLRGPRGIGLLYVRGGVFERQECGEPPMLDVRAAGWTSRDDYFVYRDGRRFETWDINFAAKLAFGVAIEHALFWGIRNIEAYVTSLAQRLRDLLGDIRGVRIHDVGRRRCGLISFSVSGADPLDVKEFLAARRINVSVSERALTRIDMENRNLDAVLRASVHYYNCMEELEALTEGVKEYCRRSG